jgi:ABC-2 type transport system ATP-binding protein
VKDLSFALHAGEIVGLLGRNGAGKSTTISCISGLERPDDGRVEILGVDALTDPALAHRRFAVATQEIALYPGLSVAQNLGFFAAFAGTPRSEVPTSIATMTTLLELEDLADKRVVSLSGRQPRLVHVAATLIQQATLLLLDEPTSGLDVGARATLLRAIRSVADAGVGILFSSHYLAEAEELCDRVLIIEQGSLVAAGTVAECVRNYGRPSVEIRVDGRIVPHEGSDVSAAITALDPGERERIESVRVIGSSLESVFRRVTGLDLVPGEDREAG